MAETGSAGIGSAGIGSAETGTVGSRIDGRYLVEQRLGRGGMAAVYRARDEALGRIVAVKLFDRDPASSEELHREVSEVSLLASLNHHALVTLFDAKVAVDAGVERAYFVMEYIDGSNLGERIDRGPISPVDIAAMAYDLAEALHVVHSHGVVHRDVKPANVLLMKSPLPDREFRSKLGDFGISYLIDSTRVTAAGTVIGTAAYLSPEQAQGITPTAATDVYSLGLVLLECHTGHREFGGSMVEAVSARLGRDPVVPDSLDAEWGELLTRMTSRDPASRPTALEVATTARHLVERAGTVWTAVATPPGATSPMPAMSGDFAPTVGMPVPPPVERSSRAAREDATLAMPEATRGYSASETVPMSAADPAGETIVMPAAMPSADSDRSASSTRSDPPAGPVRPDRMRPDRMQPDRMQPDPMRPGPMQPGPIRRGPPPPVPALPAARPASAVAVEGDRRRRSNGLALKIVTVLLVVAAILAAAVAFGLIDLDEESSTPAPTLPVVDGRLGTDLQQLMDEVTP